ncbi:hypothetical protein GPROT2_03584 [Gammaproteobacteria bacterium]|nr:hypothetical protein GPROT2_03584 [Gammaproteobacteria bacterium]
MLIHRAFRLTLAALVVMGVSSCATDPLKAFTDELLGYRPAPKSVSDVQTNSTRSGTQSHGCSEIKVVVPTDVDTAYARVMSRLRFRTLDERKRFADAHSIGLMDEGFRHTAQPGSYYRMADLVGWQEPGRSREVAWLEVELIRNGPSRTNFTGTHCVSRNDPEYGDVAFRASVERRLRESVR